MEHNTSIRYDPDQTILVFLDEYGNSSLQYSTQPLARYLSVAALSVKQRYYQEVLVPRFSTLKRALFGTDNVYLHYRKLFHRLPPFDKYSEEETARIWKKIVSFLGSLDISLRCVCIDKTALIAKIPVWERNPYKDPYELALALHIERIVFQTDSLSAEGGKVVARVVAESRTPPQNRLVNEAYEKIWRSGHVFFEMQHTTTPARIQAAIPRHDLPFRSKADRINGLELVDIATNPMTWLVMNQYRCDSRPLRSRDTVFYEHVGHRIDKDYQGRLKGWGLKLYPTR